MTKIIGHRGAIRFAKENTLTSFEKAINLGCYSIELDVRMSKDKFPVVFHDATTTRITGKKKYIEKLTLQEIKNLDRDIPTLQEAIDLCKNRVKLHIELKGEGTAKPVYELIENNGIREQVYVISYKDHLLREIKKYEPSLKVGFLFDKKLDNLWEIAKGFEFICPQHRFITRKFVFEAKSKGHEIYAYTIKDKKISNKLFKFGVEQIGTDIPEELIQ